MKDITPKDSRCRFGACPGVYDLEDGRVLVVGKHVMAKDLSDFAHAGGFLIADDERGVIVPRELLKGL